MDVPMDQNTIIVGVAGAVVVAVVARGVGPLARAGKVAKAGNGAGGKLWPAHNHPARPQGRVDTQAR